MQSPNLPQPVFQEDISSDGGYTNSEVFRKVSTPPVSYLSVVRNLSTPRCSICSLTVDWISIMSNHPRQINRNIDKIPFHPYFSIKDTVGFIILIIILTILKLKEPWAPGFHKVELVISSYSFYRVSSCWLS